MNDIELLASNVLNMLALLETHKKNNLTAKYLSKKIDPEELHNSFLEMVEAQSRVYRMCMDILGIEED